MPRKGENIYKRQDGRYEGRYIKEYGLDGKAKYRYIYGKTYSDVKERLIRLKAEPKNAGKTVSSNLKISEWFDIWYDSQTHIKQSTKSIYQSYANKHLKPKMGTVRLKKLSRDLIQQFIDELSIELSPKTVRAVYSMLKLCLTAAYEKHLIGNVVDKICLPKTVSKDVKVLTKQEQKRLEQVIEAENKENDIGILICLYTGIRIGELCALKWENINLDRKIMTIDKTMYSVQSNDGKCKTKIILSSPKSVNSERDIPIAELLSEKLSKILDPFLVVLNALPKTALAPIIIVWAGAGIQGIVVTAVTISVVVTILSAYNYFINVDEEKIKMLKSFGATKSQLLFKLIIPSNIGNLINLTKINIGMAWVGVIVGEFLVSRNGLGYLIVYGSQVFKLDLVMMGVFVLSFCAWIMYEILNIVEKLYNSRK